MTSKSCAHAAWPRPYMDMEESEALSCLQRLQVATALNGPGLRKCLRVLQLRRCHDISVFADLYAALQALPKASWNLVESRMSCATLLKLHGTHTMTYDDMVSEGLLIDWGILDILCYPSISIHCSKEKHRTRKSNGWTADWMDLNILNYFNLFYSLISLGRQSNPRQIPGELRRIQHSSRLGFQEGKAMLQAASALTRHALKSIKKTGAQQDVMERNVPCAMRCIFVYCILMCTPYIRIYIFLTTWFLRDAWRRRHCRHCGTVIGTFSPEVFLPPSNFEIAQKCLWTDDGRSCLRWLCGYHVLLPEYGDLDCKPGSFEIEISWSCKKNCNSSWKSVTSCTRMHLDYIKSNHYLIAEAGLEALADLGYWGHTLECGKIWIPWRPQLRFQHHLFPAV